MYLVYLRNRLNKYKNEIGLWPRLDHYHQLLITFCRMKNVFSVFLLCFCIIQLITATNGKIPDIFLRYADNPDPPPSTDLAKMARYVMHYSGT